MRLQLTLGPGFTVLCGMNVFLSVISKSAFLSEKLLEVKTLELLACVPLRGQVGPRLVSDEGPRLPFVCPVQELKTTYIPLRNDLGISLERCVAGS